MKRRLVALAFSGALLAALAGPAGVVTAAGTDPSQTGLGQNCPSIVDGDGAYIYEQYGLTAPTVTFFFDLASASCKSTDYALVFLPTDSVGRLLSLTPAFSQSWRGDGVSTQFLATHEFPVTDYPAGLCVYATATKGGNTLHYAPSGDSAPICVWLELDPTSSGGQPFRG